MSAITRYNSDRYNNVWNVVRSLLKDGAVCRLESSDQVAMSMFCQANRLGGLVYFLASRSNRMDVPWVRMLRTQTMEAAATGVASDRLIRELLNELAENGIDSLPIKGAVFRHLLYSDPATRLSVDLDVLVRPEQYEKARATLDKAGFRHVPFGQGRPVTERDLYEHMYVHPNFKSAGCLVELHRGFSHPDRYPIDPALVFKQSLDIGDLCARVNINQPDGLPYPAGTRFMTPEYTLVHQFVHNAAHNFNVPLISAFDVKLIVEKWNPDWKQVIDLTKRWRLSAAGFFTLSIARDCLAAKIPDRVLAALEPSGLRRRWLELFIATEGSLVPGLHGLPQVTFFRYTNSPRLQQALVGFPLIDGPIYAARFGTLYVWLRIRDVVAECRSRL